MSILAPQSLYPGDTRLSELGHSETLLLMTLRLWALPYRNPGKQYPDWRTGLVQSGAGDQACAAFEALGNILLSYSNRLIDVRCTCHPQLGSDEAWFLQTTALLQDNQHMAAQAILADWLPLAVQGMAALCAIHLAEALRKHHVIIPLFTRKPAAVISLDDFRLKRQILPADTGQQLVLH